MKNIDRRRFIKISAITGMGLGLGFPPSYVRPMDYLQEKRIGMIGLDTSHSTAFTKEFNVKQPEYSKGFKVASAYPYGSRDIKSSVDRIVGYTDEVKKMGVAIEESIEDVISKSDYILLETNDGRTHLEQALPVLKAGIPMFIDKPIAASLVDAIVLFRLSEHYGTPIFSASSLRYAENVQAVADGKIGKVIGADTYSPAVLEPTHPDFFWYGIHGVEMLYSVMGRGCKEISRTHTADTDIVVGEWQDGRIGSFRGTRSGKHTYGGTAYGETGDLSLGPYTGYGALLEEIIRFFKTKTSPIDPKETIEIFTFMEASDQSKRQKAKKIRLVDVYNKANREAEKKFKKITEI